MDQQNENEGAPEAEAIFEGADVVRNNEARVNITWAQQNGDMPQPVPLDAAEGDIKQWVTEALRAGSVPGIAADPDVDLTDFVVDRFTPTEVRPWNLIQLRPKTAFGA